MHIIIYIIHIYIYSMAVTQFYPKKKNYVPMVSPCLCIFVG